MHILYVLLVVHSLYQLTLHWLPVSLPVIKQPVCTIDNSQIEYKIVQQRGTSFSIEVRIDFNIKYPFVL